MRTALAVAVGLTLSMGACGGSSGGTSGTTGASGGASSGAASSGGSTANSAAATGSTSGGTNGGQTTTGGSGSGGLAAGQLCSADSACASNVCGIHGSGKCCTSACDTTDSTCGATACGDTGACVYPSAAMACGAGSCNGNTLSGASCTGAGACADAGSSTCQRGFNCDDGGTACLTTCTEDPDCVPGLKCSEGNCVVPSTTGPCTSGSDCASGVCGGIGDGGEDAGLGACCLVPCHATDPACDATSCDATTGQCNYPQGAACGAPAACFNAKLVESACDSHGACLPNPTACPNQLGCDLKHDACNSSCTQDSDCASGAWCDTSAGTCQLRIATGACTENDACSSGICSIAGTGNCCAAACSNTAAPCGASDCDAKTGACSYPDGTTLCGSISASCSGTTQQNPSACDGTGNCNDSPGTVDCTPYACGQTACFSTCTDNTSCASNDFCDPTNSACCTGLSAGGTIAVDSKNGKDAACCGIGTTAACQTLFQAMTLIDAAQATGVTINATVGGGGGNWAPAKEVYPIVLGWGVELNAQGVYFTDGTAAEVIDIAPFSANDTGGAVSIVGGVNGQAVIGLDNEAPGAQSTDSYALRVESGQTLAIANALVNGNFNGGTVALSVAAGGTLLLGSDESGGVTGSVDIGSPNQQDGWDGIICESDAKTSTGCTITDAVLQGQASVVISNQEDQDLLVSDFGSVTLTSMPTIGMAPGGIGFQQCGSKNDMSNTLAGAVLLQGSASVTFSNGVVQCIDGQGFELLASKTGLPNLTLSGTSITNTEMAIYASAGTATVSNCTIEYNYNGVEQDTDGTNNAVIDLSGGTTGTNNTVVCSNSAESVAGASTGPGVDVLNNTSKVLDADNVEWSTATPDIFSCAAGGANCTCAITTCTGLAGTDDMNAVDTSTGSFTTDGNGLSAANCAPPGVFCDAQTAPCPAWESCCKPTGSRKSQCVEGPVCN